MAYTSFSLRKQTSGFGSYLQQAGATDSALQADGISSAVVIEALTTGTNTFTANIISSGTVRLEWTLEDTLVDTVTSGYQPIELLIISSFSGEPVTIRDGVFVESITSETLDTYFDDVPEVSEGRWVYYSLFVKYSTGSSYWYTRVATLYIQIPIAYNSVEDLWSKIPQYYRELDYQQEKLENGYTPLYSFLELFGNEIDRTRTLVESIAISNDPELAVTPALSQLAYETGLEITVDDLGTSKVRTLLNNIGTLRQQKGTIGSICSYISAMSGCPVTYTYNAALPKPHVFTVYAQRVNFISDPEFRNATITTSSGTVTQGGTTYYAKLQTTNTWGIYSYGTNTMGASNPVIVTNTDTGITLTMPANSYATRTVMVYPRKPFPYVGSTTYGNSYNYTGTAGASFSALRTSTNATRLAWESGIAGASMPVTLFDDDAWYTNTKSAYTDTSSRPSLEYIASNNRTNILTNPSFETNTTGWGTPAGVTFARTSAQALFGSWSASQARTSTTGNLNFNLAPRVSVTDGLPYTFSTYFRRDYSTTRVTQIRYQWFNAAGTIVGSTITVAQTPPPQNTWGRLSTTQTAPAGAVTLYVDIVVGSVIVGETAWIDGAMLEQSSTVGTYFDGPTIGTSSPVSSVPVLVFQMAPGSSISISDWLFEPSANNDYFSGRTREGGYIPIQDGTTGGGTFDYYWDTTQGGADQAFSYYLSDHERTIKTTERVIGQYIVPVTMLDLYSISWDYYPGK